MGIERAGGNLGRSETIRDSGAPYNLNLPPASGSGGDDFTAVSAGVNYRQENWNWNARVEQRNAETEDKKGIYSGLAGEISESLDQYSVREAAEWFTRQ